MSNTKDNKYKNKTTTFLILMIVAAVLTIFSFVNAAVAAGLSIYGFNNANKIKNKPHTMMSAVPQTASIMAAFKEDRLDLGSRSDGCYYTIIRMVNGSGYSDDEGEFVVLKKSGSVPSVDYYEYYVESGQLSPYLINYALGEDDFSDLIDEVMVENNPDIFEDRTDMVFTVVDMDSDILKTPSDFQKEKDDYLAQGMSDFFDFIMLGFLSIIGVIYSALMGLATLIGFIAFAVFMILFFVFLSKAKKKDAETAE